MAKDKKSKKYVDPTVDTLSEKLIAKQKKRAESDVCGVRNSDIHGRGVYATQDLKVGDRIIEYVGMKISKKESERRAWAQYDHAEKTGDAAVYIFTLSKKWDLDGNVPWNNARLINHSCEPNCEAWQDGKRIFLHALKEIKEGEELSFDYGFDLDCYEDHPCLCGKPGCIGYIVSRDQWPELKQLLEEKKSEAVVA